MAESLRDQLSANLDEQIKNEEPAQTPVEAPAPTETVEAAPPIDKPGRTAGRARDDSGRLLPGAAKRPETSAAQPGTSAQPLDATAQQSAPAAAETKPEPKARPKYPSTWKRDFQPLWDKVPEDLLPMIEYAAVQRESEFAKGVSTYKSEWEAARPLLEAMAPFKPYLEQNKIEPTQWITNLGNAHKQLVYSTPQERIATFAKLARDYQVPLEQMFVRGNDGQIYFNQQLLQQQAAPQQQAPQQDINQLLEEKLNQRDVAQAVAAFSSDKEKYPHFETVRATMSGLLQAGLAEDLPSAYQAAIRMPLHAEVYDAQQKLERDADVTRKQEEQRKTVEVARRNTVSTRTATPTAPGSQNGAKGLRAQLEENATSILAGRV